MNKNSTLLFSWLCLLFAAVPLISNGQCSNQISYRYYTPAGALSTSQSVPSGQSGASLDLCPNPNGTVTLLLASSSDAVLSVYKLVTVGATTTEQLVASATRGAGASFVATLPLSSQTTYRVRSSTVKCSGGTAENFADLALTPSLILSANVSSVCLGGSVTATASVPSGSAAPASYTWYVNGVLQPETGNRITRNNLQASATFTVTATTSACGATTQSITVPVSNLSTSATSLAVCSGAQPALTATYSGTGATFNWYANNVLIPAATQTGTTSSYTPTVTASTTYRVDAVTNDCRTTLSQTFQVNVGTPTTTVSPTAYTTCTGSPVSLTATSSNPTATYQWYTVTNGGAENAIQANQGGTSPRYDLTTGNQAGTTTYRVKITTSCGTSSADATVTSVANPTISAAASATTVCSGNSVNLTATTNTTGASYIWYTSASAKPLSTASSYSPVLTTASTSSTVTYRVDVISSCGTSTQTLPVITINPAVSVSPASVLIERGRSVTLTATAPAGAGISYQWYTVAGSTATPITGAVSTTYTASPTATTTYRVVASGIPASNTCVREAEATVDVVYSVLPVELVSFSATWSGKAPLLVWATASEKNNAYFAVERSFNGEAFETVGRLTGAGNSATATSYRFADTGLTQAAATQVYYRLRQVDVDGKTTNSPMRAVQVPTVAQALRAVVFPNPYESAVAVEFVAAEPGPVTLVVQDVLGKTLLTHTATTGVGRQEISLPQATKLPAGVYYLTVQQGGRKQVVKMSRQ